MKKIDRRKTYIMVLDVETAGGLDNPLTYDIGFVITDKKGVIYESRSFVVKEIFYNVKLMSTAYYCEKIPKYLEDIGNQTRKVVPLQEIRNVINSLLWEYDVSVFGAYNLTFDRRALVNTYQYLGYKGKFLQKKVDLLCIWSFACEVLYTQKTFQRVAREKNWFTEKGNVRTSAEIGYRYLTGVDNFEEDHTGLEDCIIESQILARCYKQHKKHESGIIGSPWRIANTKEIKAEFL